MSDQDERATQPDTIVPPTDREASTSPENERPAPRQAIRPLPADPWDTSFLNDDDSVFSAAVQMIAKAARANEETFNQRASFEEQHLTLQSQILTIVERAEKTQLTNFEIVHNELHRLKASDVRQDGRLADGDERFERIERSIANLKDELIALVHRATTDAATRIDALERELEKAKADAARAAQTPATA